MSQNSSHRTKLFFESIGRHGENMVPGISNRRKALCFLGRYREFDNLGNGSLFRDSTEKFAYAPSGKSKFY